jgi:hypothetical protein
MDQHTFLDSPGSSRSLGRRAARVTNVRVGHNERGYLAAGGALDSHSGECSLATDGTRFAASFNSPLSRFHLPTG